MSTPTTEIDTIILLIEQQLRDAELLQQKAKETAKAYLEALVLNIKKSAFSGYMTQEFNVLYHGNLTSIPFGWKAMIHPHNVTGPFPKVYGVALSKKDKLIVLAYVNSEGMEDIGDEVLSAANFLQMIKEVQLWMKENNITDLSPQ